MTKEAEGRQILFDMKLEEKTKAKFPEIFLNILGKDVYILTSNEKTTAA